ncbi:MAG: hypothetical protein M1813_001592 [Trichoglossum hirsutum]|nr:MAG: hypothetical protein M1813_001592 [Trichoglossum hirsutum]
MANEQATLGPLTVAPAPWTCKCETYWLLFYASCPLPENVYDPLEAASVEFSDPAVAGEFRGGLGMIQIVRYSETPVGGYDELLIIPGYFDSPGGKKNWRVTRIYVSQRDTCYNGRKNWNLPKHLARFEFSHPPTQASSAPPTTLKVQVFPPDQKALRPFFTATLQPFRWLPAVPFSTKTAGYVGMDVFLVQPPLPAGDKPGEEECGTTEWMGSMPYLYSSKARGMWVDAKSAKDSEAQGESGEQQPLLDTSELESWWPESSKLWKIGLWLEEATLIVPEPEKVAP